MITFSFSPFSRFIATTSFFVCACYHPTFAPSSSSTSDGSQTTLSNETYSGSLGTTNEATASTTNPTTDSTSSDSTTSSTSEDPSSNTETETDTNATICGDGIVDDGEECDDGNINNNDTCTNLCKNAFCGDGIVWNQQEGQEQCDDGNMIDNDACTNNCMSSLQQVVAGGEHTCALFNNGKVRCWGYGTSGQLGYGSKNNIGDGPGEMPPADVDIGGTVALLTAGGHHSCALLNNEKVRCWGRGIYGQLGYGNQSNIGDDEIPAFAGDIDVGGTVTQLTAGWNHSCVLLNNGKVRCWGYGFYGQLGYGNKSNTGDGPGEMPPADVDVGGTVTQITTGENHTCARLNDGKVRCWGYGTSGQLGYGNKNNIGDDPGEMPPADVDVGGTVTQLAAGASHTCVLLNGGKVRCWGYGTSGQLGYGNKNNIGDDEIPASAGDVDVGGTVVQLAAGVIHTCGLLDDGKVRCWGYGFYGQLGYGNTNNIGDDETPAFAGDVDVGETIVQLILGGYHTCALPNNGNVRCWGLGGSGQLGYGNKNSLGNSEVPSALNTYVPIF